MIVVVDNLIDHETANTLHNFAKTQISNKFDIWGYTKVTDVKQFEEHVAVKDSLHKILNEVNKYCGNVVFDWGQFVEWPLGANQPFHCDMASDKTVLTSITYLNNNFRGGETIFEDGTVIAPRPGRTVFFDGSRYIHGVYAVTAGASRFTLPIWYKRENNG